MATIKKFEIFNESYTPKAAKNVVSDLCISMLLLNPTFLDSILDKGQKARYTENSNIFLNDLKNLLFGNNRLKLGKFTQDGKCVVDNEISKLNNFFNAAEFDIEKDWNDLVSARITSRNIQDKLLMDDKLTKDDISYVFWIGPNKDKEHPEDIVLELTDGNQFSFYLNKKLSHTKTISFNTVIDTLIEENSDRLYSEDYIERWDKLTSEFVRLTYEGANAEIQKHIAKYIEPNRIGSLTWNEYNKIKHMNPEYKHLGEFIPEFNKNILKFADLMSEIWKNSEEHLSSDAIEEWTELKLVMLNSRIIEHLISTSFSQLDGRGETGDDKFTMADGRIKMRLMRLLVEQLGATERNVYYLNNNGNEFYRVPSKEWFRDNYDNFSVKYDLHTELVPSADDDKNDSNFRIRVSYQDEPLISMNLITKFSGGELSGKLNTKVQLDLADDFNYKTK